MNIFFYLSNLNHYRNNFDLLSIQQSKLFNTYNRSTQSIINTLLDSHQTITDEFKSQLAKLAEFQAQTNSIIVNEHQKTRAEIISTIKQSGINFEKRSTEALFREALKRSKPASDQPIETMLLDSLYFRTIKDRHDEISDAYKKIFEWIYQYSEDANRTWSNFAEWLDQGKDIFWITGKAGSGNEISL